MTCIIAANGIIAADMQRVGPHKCSVTKVWSHGGSIFADAGDGVWGEIFQEWVKDGQKLERRDAIAKLLTDMGGEWIGLEVRPDRQIYMWSVPFIPLPMHTPVYGIGSGAPYALGAYSRSLRLDPGMEERERLQEAIAVAHEWDEYTGLEVQTISLDDALPKRKRRGK